MVGQRRRRLSGGADRREPVRLGRVAVPRRGLPPARIPVFAHCRLGRRKLALVLGRVLGALRERTPWLRVVVASVRPWWSGLPVEDSIVALEIGFVGRLGRGVSPMSVGPGPARLAIRLCPFAVLLRHVLSPCGGIQ